MPQREAMSKPELMISLAALSFGELPTRTSKAAAKPMVFKNQELCFHGHDCLPWLCSGPSGVSHSAREVWESLGSISPSPRTRTTRKSERLTSGAEKLGPQASRWYTSWNRPGLSHISTSNPGAHPTHTCQVAEIFGPSWLSIFYTPPIFSQPRPFPPKPRATPHPACSCQPWIDRVSSQQEVGRSPLSQEGSPGRPPRPAELCA